jgi:hypothetical protein
VNPEYRALLFKAMERSIITLLVVVGGVAIGSVIVRAM